MRLLIKRTCYREYSLLSNDPLHWLMPVLLFIIASQILPLIGIASGQKLPSLAPPVIWMNAMFAVLLSSHRYFNEDIQDGTMEQFLLSSQPLPVIIASRWFCHWTLLMPGLLLGTMLTAITYHLPAYSAAVTMLTLLAGIPAIHIISWLTQALALPSHMGSVLTGLMLFPLSLPVIIFGGNACLAAQNSWPFASEIAILCAISLAAVSFLPMLIAAVLRVMITVF